MPINWIFGHKPQQEGQQIVKSYGFIVYIDNKTKE